MLIAGIIGSEGKLQTASIINSILTSKGEKVSIIDSTSMPGFDGKKIKAYIKELEKNNIDLLILKTGLPDIDRFLPDDIRFDILVYTDKAKDSDTFDRKEQHVMKLKRIFSLMGEKSVAIVNVDDSQLIDLLQGMRHRFITYGFNTKASVTTSSVGDTVFKDGFICCLQRPVSTRGGKIIEPQEYKLHLDAGEFDSHNVLAAASFAIVNGIDLNKPGKIY
ncbi:MAG: Mur ligase family protein [Acetivibrionales bacterium]|jgi:UDP-N-acetylmuramyl tripeptide synthase